MIDILIVIVLAELIVFLAILIVYWADYTNSYLHCHCKTEPYKADNSIGIDELYWKECYESLYDSVKDKADDEICNGWGTVIEVLFDDK